MSEQAPLESVHRTALEAYAQIRQFNTYLGLAIDDPVQRTRQLNIAITHFDEAMSHLRVVEKEIHKLR